MQMTDKMKKKCFYLYRAYHFHVQSIGKGHDLSRPRPPLWSFVHPKTQPFPAHNHCVVQLYDATTDNVNLPSSMQTKGNRNNDIS